MWKMHTSVCLVREYSIKKLIVTSANHIVHLYNILKTKQTSLNTDINFYKHDKVLDEYHKTLFMTLDLLEEPPEQ